VTGDFDGEDPGFKGAVALAEDCALFSGYGEWHAGLRWF
jgi:hypothetical protein